MNHSWNDARESPTDALALGLGRLFFVASVLTILFAGTFPFDFGFHANALSEVVGRFDWRWNPYDPHFVDRGENILFFIPFGFGLAAVIPHFLKRWTLLIALLAGTLLSATVEAAQTFISFRDPCFADVWCNATGGVIGAGVYLLLGAWLLQTAATLLQHLKVLAHPGVLGGLLLLYAAAQLAAPLLIRPPGDFRNSDPNLPLILGNESAGDRPWVGRVSQVFFADRICTPEEAASLANGAAPDAIFQRHLIGEYEFTGTSPYLDRMGNLPPLEWIHSPGLPSSAGAVASTRQNWLRSAGPAPRVAERIGRTSEFSFSVIAATTETSQTGPARLFGMSAGLFGRNIQLAQEDSDLVVRVRTAVRGMPDLYLRDVLADQAFHHLLVTQKDAQVVIYVDGVERGRCEITPEAKMIWRLYPRGAFRLRVERFGFRSYALIYRLLVFIPFAALLGAMLMTARISRNSKRVAAIAIIVVMASAVETILGEAAASGFQTRNLWISLAVGFGSLGAMAWWRRRRRPGTPAAATTMPRST